MQQLQQFQQEVFEQELSEGTGRGRVRNCGDFGRWELSKLQQL